MSRITRESFAKYSKELLKDGAKVCPCCLYSGLEFTTDEEHNEYWLECRACHIGIRNHLFSHVRRNFNDRCSQDEKMHKITHDIECSWFNGEYTEYITIDDDEKEEQETK